MISQNVVANSKAATSIPALSVTGISKSFAGIRAVNGVDLSVPHGERRAVIGPNGAGKTTLFNLITGVLRADTGSVVLLGQDVTRKPVRARANLGLGRTYQISNLLLDLTVEENLVLASSPHKFPNALVPWRSLTRERERARQVATDVGLHLRLDEAVKNLSHGEQRQLELAMAMAPSPRVIMMDEPAAGLSPGERRHMMQLIEKLDPSVTIILIEHDMDVVLNLMQVVTVLHQGEVIAEGSPSAIQENEQVQEVYMGAWGHA